jgi:pyridinium-3,5-biscarboxylic acid mononucleotide sulfurtransferase
VAAGVSMTEEKRKAILNAFSGKKAVVAYSGGTDSTALLHILSSAAVENIEAVTFSGPHIPAEDLERAKRFCRKTGVSHSILPVDPLAIKKVRLNDIRRCYYCKRYMFKALRKRIGSGENLIIADGTNLDDLGDYRPGLKALDEQGIFSPFAAVGLGKREIIAYLRSEKLDEWIRPSGACLLSRLSYGLEASPEILHLIGEAELFLRKLGFDQCRVRIFPDSILIIEVDEDKLAGLNENADLLKEYFASCGFRHIAYDICGYRSGSMNHD